jgi:hypothetical protein
MATVPNNSTFALSDVVAVVGGTSLTEAFANAVAGGFDPSYAGSKNNLLNFRNYNSVFLSLSTTSVIFHYDKTVLYYSINFTVQHSSTYTFAWTTGTYFSYSKAGDTFTISCNYTNISGNIYNDTLTITMGGSSVTFQAVQFTSPN